MGAESKDPDDFYRTKGCFREFDQCSVPETALGVHARAGTEPGIREPIIGGTPYVVLYRVRGQRVIISTIWHGGKSCEREGAIRPCRRAENC
jgi:hypothetical protein